MIFLLAMNVATLVSDTVYEMLHRIAWGAVELVSDRLAERRPKTRAEIEAEASRAQVDADAASNEATKLQKDLHASQREVTLAKDRLQEESTRHKSLAGELEVRDRRIAEMTADIDQVRKGRQQAIDAATSLRTRVVNSIRRDASTEAIGAVPFIGTAVFLGSVAYELNDACEQLREVEALEAALRGKGAEPVPETICLLSYEDMVAALTGQDRAYAKCVSDRIATNDLNPPSCAGYDPALPTIEDSSKEPAATAALLPRID